MWGSSSSWVRGFAVAALVWGSLGAPTFAQSSDANVDVGGRVAVLRLSEFDTTDTGIGVHAAWRATPIVALDGELTWFPGGSRSAVDNRIAHQQRTLGLVGARSGIQRGPVELFGRARAGFLRFAPLDPAVCVAVTTVPQPIDCVIVPGYTAFATDLGGGVAVNVANRLQFRADAGDLMVRYGMRVYRYNGKSTEGFTSHNLQVSSGLTWRF
jgi:Outer membrane protein beta-barrel domain